MRVDIEDRFNQKISWVMRETIRQLIEAGFRDFAIYPFGHMGRQLKEILNSEFGIAEKYIIDDYIQEDIKNLVRTKELPKYWNDGIIVLLVSNRLEIADELREGVYSRIPPENKVDILLAYDQFDEISDRLNSGKKTRILFNQMKYAYDLFEEGLGNNSGNLVYSQGIKDLLSYDFEEGLSAYWKSEKLGKANVYSMMAGSNYFNYRDNWYEHLIPVLEHTDMHFTINGLGTQAGLGETPENVIEKMSERQLYFFRLVGERAETIGVRGEFTAECLNKIGIKNVDVVGCPSFYQYDSEYKILPQPDLVNVLTNLSASHTKVKDLAEKCNASYIAQHKSDSDKAVMFTNFKQWNNYIKNSGFTFCFGTRFHGNMIALRNGVPSLWIVHDMRTKELTEYLKLPHIMMDDLQKIEKPEQLLEYCDYSEVYKQYPVMVRRYENFLKKNGMDMKKSQKA